MKKTGTFLTALFGAMISAAQPVVIWEKTWGGSKSDGLSAMVATSDGHVLFCGSSESADGDLPGNAGETDFWLLKTDSLGVVVWSRAFGGSGYDGGYLMTELADGNYLAAGFSNSTDGDFAQNHGNIDIALLKIAPDGSLLWAKTVGGSNHDQPNKVEATADGGFVLTVNSRSSDGDLPENDGNWDCWLLKFGAAGGIEWKRHFGGSDAENLFNVLPSAAGGFWATIDSWSSDGDFAEPTTTRKVWLLRLANDGSVIWKKRMPGNLLRNFPSRIGENTAGELVLVEDFEGQAGAAHLFRFDQSGGETALGPLDLGIPDNHVAAFAFAPDGGFLMCGNVIDPGQLADPMVARLGPDATPIWQKTWPGAISETATRLLQTADGGLLLLMDGLADGRAVKLGATLSAINAGGADGGFSIFPNPLLANEPLQILLENDFLGTVKIELFSLDGRLFSFFEKEKTARRQLFEIQNGQSSGAFFVRVLEKNVSHKRLVIRN